MGLLRLASFVILTAHLFGVHGYLPELRRNRLRTGDDKELPDARLIDCVRGKMILSDFHATHTYTPTQALVRENFFGRFAFTSHGVQPGVLRDGGIGRFSIVKLNHGVLFGKTAFALQPSAVGEYAYWMPQGQHIDVPKHPSANQPHFIFTPDFSGCSWTVTPMSNGMMRVKHVEGGHEDGQFNNLPTEAKGGTTSYAMQFRDYGYVFVNGQLIKHSTAYAYMHYSTSTRAWTLHVQHQTCAPRPGNPTYVDGKITAMKMNYFQHESWQPITGTDFWRIPTGRAHDYFEARRRHLNNHRH
ncbi:uncharacterized protein LOC125228242 [Leguminivora glycinivorella]|uniref:uncharacterized protein LOC125228242 n=1 Tax=Leguminivora glycinivorella TaxID=1035111 RepID=UPI00200F7B84|nr:uncharacterized protein LOC125228242 [Leguminivora glycinivorella]